jgi:hypothetical protein
MIKRWLFSLFLMVTAFTCLGFANLPPNYRLKFQINTPFVIESDAKYALPAGEYWVKELGFPNHHQLSLEYGRERTHMAYLDTIRIDRGTEDWKGPSRVNFDTENSLRLPVLKELIPSSDDGYEVLGGIYSKNALLIEVATLTKKVTTERGQYTIEPFPTQETVVQPQAEITPEPEVTPAVEPREEPKPVEPIKERKRVRKD